jgi:hypothetical protein
MPIARLRPNMLLLAIAMTPVEVFEALNGGSVSYLECKDGSKFGGTPLTVNFCGDGSPAPLCLEVTIDGLILHFNSKGSWADLRAEEIPLADIVNVR